MITYCKVFLRDKEFPPVTNTVLLTAQRHKSARELVQRGLETTRGAKNSAGPKRRPSGNTRQSPAYSGDVG